VRFDTGTETNGWYDTFMIARVGGKDWTGSKGVVTARAQNLSKCLGSDAISYTKVNGLSSFPNSQSETGASVARTDQDV